MIGVIYKISSPSGNIYIGSAVAFGNRRRCHLHQLRKGKHHSLKLQRAYNKYGENDLIFSIIARCPAEYLIRLEQWFIDTLKPAYNVCKVAGSILGYRHRPEVIERNRLKDKKRKVSEEYKAVLRQTMKGNKHAVGNKCARKVTPEIITQVNELRANGFGCRRIAAKIGLNKTTILNIFNNKYNYGRDS